jgi:hypothetical protein
MDKIQKNSVIYYKVHTPVTFTLQFNEAVSTTGVTACSIDSLKDGQERGEEKNLQEIVVICLRVLSLYSCGET